MPIPRRPVVAAVFPIHYTGLETKIHRLYFANIGEQNKENNVLPLGRLLGGAAAAAAAVAVSVSHPPKHPSLELALVVAGIIVTDIVVTGLYTGLGVTTSLSETKE